MSIPSLCVYLMKFQILATLQDMMLAHKLSYHRDQTSKLSNAKLKPSRNMLLVGLLLPNRNHQLDGT